MAAEFTTVAQIESALGIDLTAAEETQAADLITIATGIIREAAGAAITRDTSTVSLSGDAQRHLKIPLSPLISVSAVTIDGDAVSDWTLVGEGLWRAAGWAPQLWRPSVVTLTAVHGYATVPAPVRALTESMVTAALQFSKSGTLSPPPGVQSESLDGYSVSYTLPGRPEVAHALDLTDRTRRWLRKTYGPGDLVLQVH